MEKQKQISGLKFYSTYFDTLNKNKNKTKKKKKTNISFHGCKHSLRKLHLQTQISKNKQKYKTEINKVTDVETKKMTQRTEKYTGGKGRERYKQMDTKMEIERL